MFPFLLCLLLLFFSQLFIRSPQTTILPFCISFSWGWFYRQSTIPQFKKKKKRRGASCAGRGRDVRPACGRHSQRRGRWWPCVKARFQEQLVRDWSEGDVPHSAPTWAVPALLWASLLTGISFLIRGKDVCLNLEAFLEERCSVTVGGWRREQSPGYNLLCPPTLRQGPATSVEVKEGQRLPSLLGPPQSVGSMSMKHGAHQQLCPFETEQSWGLGAGERWDLIPSPALLKPVLI